MEGYYFGPYCCLGTDSRISKDFNLVVQKAKGEGFSYVVKYTLLPGVSSGLSSAGILAKSVMPRLRKNSKIRRKR